MISCSRNVSKAFKKDDKFKVLTYNIRSFGSGHYDQFLLFLSNLNSLPDIIVLTETWLCYGQDNDYPIPGYNSNALIRGKTGGGVSIYVREEYSFSIIDEFIFRSAEAIFLRVSISTKSNSLSSGIVLHDIVIGGVYRPFFGSNKYLEFHDDLEKVLNFVSVNNYSCIIAGDMNINLVKNNDLHVVQYTSLFASYNFNCHIVQPTRIDACLDHIFSNISGSFIKSSVLDCDISDHDASLIEIINLSSYFSTSSNRAPYFSFRGFDINVFSSRVSQVTLNEVLNAEDANLAMSLFCNKFTHVCSPYLLVNSVIIKTPRIRQPFVTTGLAISSAHKNKLYKLHKQNPNDSELLHRYKRYKKLFNKLLWISKQRYYHSKIEKCAGDMKKTWGIVREILNKKVNMNHPVALSVDGKRISDSVDIADAFNVHFSSVGSKLADRISSSDGHFSDFLRDKFVSLMPDNNFSTEELKKVIVSLDETKSAGCDGIHPRLIKLAVDSVASPLCHVFNCCLNQGVYPSGLKIAKVIPLYKTGDPTNVTNYRPISLLSVVNKIFEKLIHSRLIKHLIDHDILNPYQHGFRPGRSTTTALASILPRIQDAIDNKLMCLGLFIDLKKAFDTVPHSILISKLNHYGIQGKFSCLLESYLSHRKQRVWIGNCTSNELYVPVGVPQGSVLGPLMFLLHINDIVHSLPTVCEPRLFADDTGIFLIGNDLNSLFTDAQISLNGLHQWLLVNKLSLNLSKTNYVLFSSHHVDCGDRLLLLDGVKIDRKRCVKYLGLHLDECLKWDEHISAVSRKVAPIIGSLWRVRKFLTRGLLRCAYFSLVESHLCYGLEFWGSAYDVHMDTLIKLQKRAIRCCTFSHFLSNTEPLFISMNILPLRKLYLVRLCLFVYKILFNLSPPLVEFSWNFSSNARALRSSDRSSLIVPRIRTNYGSQSLHYIGARAFNLLPSELIQVRRSYHLFKNHVKFFFRDLDLDFNEFLYFRSIR